MLETWELSETEPSTTQYLSKVNFFQRHTIGSAFKIAGGTEPSSSTSRSKKQNSVPTDFAQKVAKTFFDTLTLLLDGLLQLVNEDSPVPLPEKLPQAAPTAGSLRTTVDFTDAVGEINLPTPA